MTDYVLPRTESGEIDFDKLHELIAADHLDDAWADIVEAMRKIDAAARADERERCANAAFSAGLTKLALTIQQARVVSDAIRTLGDIHE